MVVSLFQRFLVGVVALLSTQVAAFQPPADQPAVISPLSSKSTLFAVAAAGQRLVAVGMRGHVVTSDDNGNSWRQSAVPVSTDLVAVSFPTETSGWAVGHGGVVLHTSDGGLTWTKQMSGRVSSSVALRYYEQQVQPSDAKLANVLKQERLLASDSGSPSFLDVCFESDKVGFVVGTFNRIFRTEDGGKTWEPWMDRTENPESLNIYGVKFRGGDWYLAGERGMVWRLDSANRRFVAVPTQYKGTLFGIAIGRDSGVMVYGMRGSFFESKDKGKTWSKIETGAAAGVTGVTQMPDGRLVLANQAGGYIVSNQNGNGFSVKHATSSMSNFGVLGISGNKIVLVGNQGVQVEVLH